MPQDSTQTAYTLGIDIGSTTLKCALLKGDAIVALSYERHFSKALETLAARLEVLKEQIPHDAPLAVAFSGSAAMGLANDLNLPFVQEVFATKVAAETFLDRADVIVELGGEDAKVLFLTGGVEVRMNGSCAGGTGAFIDQMATLLGVDVAELNELASTHEKIYPVASRCGVFAKSDIQPLLNQGATKPDVAASIFNAVVNQTIAGLAQGRRFEGQVVYLGGPLTFLDQLRRTFDETLKTTGICPENSLYYVALGAALGAQAAPDAPTVTLDEFADRIAHHEAHGTYATLPPLFTSHDEYDAFLARHAAATIPDIQGTPYKGDVYLGIDSGSTTIKLVVINEAGELVFSRYASNGGNPIPLVKGYLEEFYAAYPDAHIIGSASTGYGEQIVKEAFNLDFGIVETVAHFMAAKQFEPQVDFIIDIGGQDIKCFKIVDGAIDDIFLNEACSSGCGSFLQSFAQVLGYRLEDFAHLGLFAKHPVDLGSRCTVFMNSSVKQAQKDGAALEDIAAGLSASVVKNALYKVIRTTSPDLLGRNIVVQGGTFLNDSVLKAFEDEIGRPVVRPAISGLMGAFGAALYARDNIGAADSTTLGPAGLAAFSHEVRSVTCRLCGNHCSLTINTFDGGRKYIAGNRCERPIKRSNSTDDLNLFAFKQRLIEEYRHAGVNLPEGKRRGRIGLPLALNLYEMLPFWSAFFTSLGFETVVTPFSSHELYVRGQHTIPSDTACYPAKLAHGHIEYLLNEEVDAIFYPCMTYNFDEHRGDNHYNCPVVAYYPEVIQANIPEVKEQTVFLYPYIGIHRPKDFTLRIGAFMQEHFGPIMPHEIRRAVKAAYAEHAAYLQRIHDEGARIIKRAEAAGKPIIVLAGRPYHLDPEVNHGVDKLICSCGAALITEDAVSDYVTPFKTNVLNQWTYHARLYAAARYVTAHPTMNLIQLVSFGCGVDAITGDEVRSILRAGDKIFTQIKIDEITNLGAINIRLRSLFAALDRNTL